MSSLAWNVDPLDYNRPGTDAIISVVNGATTNGSIVLLHDGGGDRSQTFEALDTIIPYLQSLYDLVPVPPF